MFSAPLLEGIWRTEGAEHYVHNPQTGQESRVHAVLAPLVGQTVQVAAHHMATPPTPADRSLFVSIMANGSLSYAEETGVYSILSFDGSKTELDFSRFHGYSARFLGVTSTVAEQMRDTVTAEGLGDLVKGLTQQASQLRELLDGLVPGDH